MSGRYVIVNTLNGKLVADEYGLHDPYTDDLARAAVFPSRELAIDHACGYEHVVELSDLVRYGRHHIAPGCRGSDPTLRS